MHEIDRERADLADIDSLSGSDRLLDRKHVRGLFLTGEQRRAPLRTSQAHHHLDAPKAAGHRRGVVNSVGDIVRKRNENPRGLVAVPRIQLRLKLKLHLQRERTLYAIEHFVLVT